jgi:hypothetical protein
LFAAVRPADAGMRALAMLPPPSCGHCRDGIAITRPAFTPGERRRISPARSAESRMQQLLHECRAHAGFHP